MTASVPPPSPHLRIRTAGVWIYDTQARRLYPVVQLSMDLEKPPWKLRTLAVSFVWLAGCGSDGPPRIATPAPPQHVERGPGIPAADYSAIEAIDPTRAANWRKVVDSARTVIASDDFQTAVKARTLEAVSHGPAVDGADVLEVYLGASAVRGQVITQYAITKADCDHQTASTGVYSTLPHGASDHAIVTLNTCTLERAASPDDFAFACAVNTAAHEFTHSVVVDGAQPYQDGGHRSDPHPMVSYTLGAIAQCVYLKQHDKLTMKLDACVTTVGDHVFNPGTCCADWSKRCNQ
jgi:hypothetical protein